MFKRDSNPVRIMPSQKSRSGRVVVQCGSSDLLVHSSDNGVSILHVLKVLLFVDPERFRNDAEKP